eukprot:c23100_g1_i1.p1 GENE.c23100_g1_i1~~c23100_g1_i1.p1  ORF type:complete len:183 (+),score=72.88 c23100_g1_i1:66-551(+)
MADNVNEFLVKDEHGNNLRLGDLLKKATLIVNVASECGLTTQNYRELQDLYNKHKDSGFEILAFPCNQFGGQEPKCTRDVKGDMSKKFQVTFPILEKVDVNGDAADPLFKFLQEKLPVEAPNLIQWNFTKFLIVNGEPTKRYHPKISPNEFEEDIVKALTA